MLQSISYKTYRYNFFCIHQSRHTRTCNEHIQLFIEQINIFNNSLDNQTNYNCLINKIIYITIQHNFCEFWCIESHS